MSLDLTETCSDQTRTQVCTKPTNIVSSAHTSSGDSDVVPQRIQKPERKSRVDVQAVSSLLTRTSFADLGQVKNINGKDMTILMYMAERVTSGLFTWKDVAQLLSEKIGYEPRLNILGADHDPVTELIYIFRSLEAETGEYAAGGTGDAGGEESKAAEAFSAGKEAEDSEVIEVVKVIKRMIQISPNCMRVQISGSLPIHLTTNEKIATMMIDAYHDQKLTRELAFVSETWPRDPWPRDVFESKTANLLTEKIEKHMQLEIADPRLFQQHSHLVTRQYFSALFNAMQASFGQDCSQWKSHFDATDWNNTEFIAFCFTELACLEKSVIDDFKTRIEFSFTPTKMLKFLALDRKSVV